MTPEQCVAAYHAHPSLSAVARRFHRTPATIKRTLILAGVIPNGPEGTKLPKAELDKVVVLYRQGLTCEEIGHRVTPRLTAGAVRRRLVASGTKRRRRGPRAQEVKP